jgi:RNA polymerase sigma-70 factor, ECF subfamily
MQQIDRKELSPDQETELIRAAQADPAQFTALYRQFAPSIFRYLYSRTGQVADAEDLTSQTFLETFEALPHFRQKGPFAAWLFTIARRRAIDHIRHKKPEDFLGEVRMEESADPLVQVIGLDETSKLLGCLAKLKESERELLRLRFAARLEFREIARIIGKREAAVKMTLYRLLRRLESELEDPHE